MEIRMSAYAYLVLTDIAVGLTDHNYSSLFPYICQVSTLYDKDVTLKKYYFTRLRFRLVFALWVTRNSKLKYLKEHCAKASISDVVTDFSDELESTFFIK